MSVPFMPQDIYGVIGWPLAQSLSPLIHNTGFQTLNLPGVYLRWEVAPDNLPRFLDAVRALPIRGLSVTIPHKVAVMPLLDGLTREAEAVGAVNTLFWEDGKLRGDNTDVTGFMAPLKALALPTDLPILLLGAGGAARAVAAGLTLAGFRQMERAKWRTVLPVDPEAKNPIRIELNDTTLTVIDQDAEWSPEERIRTYEKPGETAGGEKTPEAAPVPTSAPARSPAPEEQKAPEDQPGPAASGYVLPRSRQIN